MGPAHEGALAASAGQRRAALAVDAEGTLRERRRELVPHAALRAGQQDGDAEIDQQLGEPVPRRVAHEVLAHQRDLRELRRAQPAPRPIRLLLRRLRGGGLGGTREPVRVEAVSGGRGRRCSRLRLPL